MQYYNKSHTTTNQYSNILLRLLIIFGIFMCNNICADPIESSNQHANLNTSGSKQYSNGNFAPPTLTGKKGKKYYTKEQLSNPENNPVSNDSKTYSSEPFTNKDLTGKKGAKYYTKAQKAHGPNKATISSKSGSNQLFNYPKHNTDQNSQN